MQEPDNRHRAITVAATYSELASRFPMAFPFPPVPLAIGIDKMLMVEGFSRRRMRHFLRRYCSRPEYLFCLIAGRSRIGPHGGMLGVVTESEAFYARSKLEQGTW
jgi:sRNA-binding protein